MSVEYFGEVPDLPPPQGRWRKTVMLALCIGAWYLISISITLFNKWLFSVYDFHFPLLITSLHVGLKVRAAGWPHYRHDGILLTDAIPWGRALNGKCRAMALCSRHPDLLSSRVVKL
eukprot:scaffold20945_cov33-Tisochrysis_lutea.AAC.5